MQRVLQKISYVMGTVGLILCFVAAGLGMCCIPSVTEALSNEYADEANSPFNRAQLVKGAVACADYTMLSHDLESLMSTIRAMNKAIDSPYAFYTDEEFLGAPNSYALDENSISHLDDCFDVVKGVRIAVIVALALVLLGLIGSRIFGGRHGFGKVLAFAGCITLGIFACLGIFALFNFDGFFDVFHSLFFEEGSWRFPKDSLLICMLPLNFWMGMGVIWICTTSLLCIAALIWGFVWMRSNRKIVWVRHDYRDDEPKKRSSSSSKTASRQRKR
ncbi:MAG: DUF1461 domain-containing protein [Eggerthellaceae bacterium]|nr:DUF1461 domain-containing protein [Eggerthellaceae bacterium]